MSISVAAVSPRRLVLLFDGTWNKRQDSTNVWRTRLMLRRLPEQILYYDEGVGTAKGEKFRGGAFGWGVSAKVLNAYLWLMETYDDANESPHGVADEIFIFGFSRGAFIARSLAGFLNISGLLRKEATRRIVDAYEFTKAVGLQRHHEEARRFRAEHSRDVTIKLLAVWDTVGALGDPRLVGRVFEDANHHKVVELPTIVKNGVHALAIDEHRELFKPTLWPRCGPAGQAMEQRWFVGAHANVGGGYDRDGLFLRPLQWIQEHAVRCGLEFSVRIRALSPLFDTSFPRDPLGEIGHGSYYLTQRFKRYDRLITLGGHTRETLDYSVVEKWAWNNSYRPHALRHVLGSAPQKRSPARRLDDAQILGLLPPPRKWTCVPDRGFSISAS
jgi:uncharacterized protein (DUF2235 family)